MQVSAISLNYGQTVSNSSVNSKGNEICSDVAYNSLNFRNTSLDKQSKIFDAINEWKIFCHRQIEQGKFDVIA